MQGIRIPNYIAKAIDKKNKDSFLENNMDSDNNHGSLSLVSWDKICKPKCEGGLGIRKFQDVNAAIIVKLRWKVLKDPDNLWVRVVSAKYLTRNNFLEVRKTGNASMGGSIFWTIDTF